ncbi:MAG TPA: TonB-dependent receptor, partial [Novosphingobium sp.]|nr:TonB-dependent receptor [Novosphingobium sp.]
TSLMAQGRGQFATQGGWSSQEADLTFTHIRGQDRLNAKLTLRESGLLRESERDVIQPVANPPLIAGGIILPVPLFGLEIDPALTAIAGQRLTMVGVPAGTTSPTLAQFAAAQPGPAADAGFHRSLRPESRALDFSLNGNARLLPWLTGSLTARLETGEDNGLIGAVRSRLTIPAGHPFSPFSRAVPFARFDPDRSLRSTSHRRTASLTAALNAELGQWSLGLNARINTARRTYRFEREVAAGTLTDPAINPFDPLMLGPIALTDSATRSQVQTSSVQATISGPLVRLPAGPVQARASASLGWNRVKSSGDNRATDRYRRRDEVLAAGLTIPLTSARTGPLTWLGDTSLTIDLSRIGLSDQAALHTRSFAATWQPARWLRLSASKGRVSRAVGGELLSGVTTLYPDVRTFDPVTGETVDVTQVAGGNPALLPERVETTQLSASIAPLPAINLQLTADYTQARTANQLGSMPSASAAVMAAFPDRFLRDDAGRLTLVDLRAVNFTRNREERLRYGLAFTVPLYPRPQPGAGPVRPASSPRPTIQANLSHAVLLDNTILIRPGLAPIDLLAGGAVGFGGGRSRHQIDGGLGLTDRGSGVRLDFVWRGKARLQTGPANAPRALRFGDLATFNLRLFVDTARIAPGESWAKGGLITLSARNLGNRRQRVFDAFGVTPLGYQPAYRDPVGRTIQIELRKTF